MLPSLRRTMSLIHTSLVGATSTLSLVSLETLNSTLRLKGGRKIELDFLRARLDNRPPSLLLFLLPSFTLCHLPEHHPYGLSDDDIIDKGRRLIEEVVTSLSSCLSLPPLPSDLQQRPSFFSSMSDYYDSPNDRDDYYCYQGPDSWSINSGAETFREQRGEEVKLIAFRSPSENEEGERPLTFPLISLS